MFKYWTILKPNLQKYLSIEIFSRPTSKNIEGVKYSQAQPPEILKYRNILKPNLQKYWSLEIFSIPTSKDIELLKYSQTQPPGPAKAKTLLQTEINIVLVSGKYFNCHCRGLYEIFWISLSFF